MLFVLFSRYGCKSINIIIMCNKLLTTCMVKQKKKKRVQMFYRGPGSYNSQKSCFTRTVVHTEKYHFEIYTRDQVTDV